MKKEENSKRRMGVKIRILMITTLPLLFACFMIAFFSCWTMQKGLKEQVLLGLKGSATGALLSLDNISRESFHMVGDDLYKGEFNVSQNMDGIDYYAESNNVEITFFYGDTRRATTILDEDGERLVNTKAPAEVSSVVLKEGKEYSSVNVDINGKKFYGYYMPVQDTEKQIIGMIFAGRAMDDISSFILSRINFIVIIAVLNYISCFIIAMVVSEKSFIRPIKKLITVAEGLARGNVKQTIEKDSNDEFGDLTDSFKGLMENINQQAYIAEKMAEGDLTVSYQPASAEDVMGYAIHNMMEDNNRNLTVINTVSERMAAGVKEIAAASNSLAQGSAEQASAVEEITASISGIAENAEVNARNASHANELIQKTKEEAVVSNEQMQHMMKAMQDINASSENISKIMKLIDDIASETHIISLNASVEAARAGVHGKGFAVVAEEIRSLAAKSTEAARNSAEMIEDSMRKAEIGSGLAEETASSLEKILGSVENMASLMGSIAEASEDQSVSVKQVDKGIMQISDVVQTNSATSEQCAAESIELSGQADQLKDAVNKYKLKNI